MDEISQLRLANRQMVAERQALLAERDRDRRVLAQRSVDTCVQMVEGLGKLLEQAAAGDPASAQVVKMLAERLDQVRVAGVLVLPNGQPRPPGS